jgi:hypothetical protein
MINEIIKRIYHPIDRDDWVVIETDRSFYELRMGGYKTVPRFAKDTHRVSHEFPDDVVIEKAYTDDENVYLCLSNGEVLYHGFTQIDSNGELSEMVRIIPAVEFQRTYGSSYFSQPGFHKLQTDSKGNSMPRE